MTPGELRVALDNAVKQQIISEYATGEGDTGSPEVQVALLTRRISDLTEHMKAHKHDFTPSVVCSSSSAVAVGCCATWSRRTCSATAR
jgi:hypothetical protein